MEKPYHGIAILNATFDGIEIVIPRKKDLFLLLFLGAWLIGWAIGEILVLTFLVSGLIKTAELRFFILCWLAGWTSAGFSAVRTILWNFRGKEIITIGQGRMTITKTGAFFFKPKTYELENIRNFKVQKPDEGLRRLWYNRIRDDDIKKNGGPIRFDYGRKVIKFGIGIDLEEARLIVAKLKDKRLLAERNFAIND